MFNNLNVTLKKIVIVFLIITLTYANLVLIGGNIVNNLISYAAEETEEQPTPKVNEELVMDKICEINGEEKRVIQFAIETGIEEENPIKQTTIKLNTNIILDETFEDIKVTSINKNSYTQGTWSITEDNMLQIFLINENEELETKNKGLDKLLVTYVYAKNDVETLKNPITSVLIKTYTDLEIDASIPEAFNINTDESDDLLLLNIENKDIHKTTIENEEKEYSENLKLDLSYRKDTSNITIEDLSKEFYNNDEAIDEEIVLKYKTTTINKQDLISLLGDNGKLTITDVNTNKLLVEITKATLEAQEIDVKTEQKFIVDEAVEEPSEELRTYVTVTNENVIIEYAIDVIDFKLDLTNIKAQSESEIELSNFVVTNTKLISNIKNLENLNYLKEEVKYAVDEAQKNIESKIAFKDTTTRASLAVDNDEWIVGQANKVEYTITLDTTTEKSEMFINPMFLLELPSSVESVNTASSEFTLNNDNGAFTGKRVFITTVLGRKFVVITLEGAQTRETIQNGDTTIDLTLELNVSENTTEGNEITKLYYQNDTVTAYESEKSFDTAEVTVSMIMESEPKDDIEEVIPDDDQTTTPEEGAESTDILLELSNAANYVIKAGDDFWYDVHILNNDDVERQNLKLTGVLPEGISIVDVVEIRYDEEGEQKIQYNFDNESRLLTINIDKLEATTYEYVYNPETEITDTNINLGYKQYKIIVKADALPDETYSREIKNIMQLEQGENILVESLEVTSTISDAIIEVEVDELGETLNESEEFVLGIKLINKGLINTTDVDIKLNIPEEISLSKYIETVLLENGQEESITQGTVSGNFEMNDLSIKAKTSCYFQITGSVNEINGSKQVTINGTVNGKDITWTLGLVDITIDPDNPEGTDTPTNPNKPTIPNNPTNPNKPTTPNNPEDSTKPGESNTYKFDLSLNQYLNKITVENSKGITTYNYKDTNFAKVEIHAKQMNGSKVTIEYNIIVKNEGTIPGYVRKIVDYIPSDLEFNAELNPDWYLGEDKKIYSVAFIDKILNPGESVEIKVILEKQMTNDNVGTITNITEIYEATNDENIEDINSIPGDKVEGQNDMSKVEVMVVTSTGTIILYTTLAIVVMAILGIGFYRVKKVTLNKKGGC